MVRGARIWPALCLAACGPTATLPLTTSGGDTDEPGLMDEGAVADESGSSSSTGSGASSEGDSSSSTTGLPWTGPGCEPPPACDRGEYVGSMLIDSAAQVESLTGYTSVTGWLEISGTDLECLTFLSCLESVGHDIDIFDNPDLVTLDGTDAIAAIGARTVDYPTTRRMARWSSRTTLRSSTSTDSMASKKSRSPSLS